jgi:hypothetical protein
MIAQTSLLSCGFATEQIARLSSETAVMLRCARFESTLKKVRKRYDYENE